jgi:thioredoxin 1
MSDDSKKKSAIHLTADDFQKTLDEAKEAGTPVFVDFYADWCGPCQIAAPIVDKLAGEYEGKAIIAKLNVDDHNSVAGQFGVMSIPTVIVFEGGEEVDRKIGFPGEAGYREMLGKVVKAD